MSDTTEPTVPTFPTGEPRTITANVVNAEQQTVTDPTTLSWTATAGTITPAEDGLSATLDSIPVGPVTVIATDGTLTGTVDFAIVDNTPTAIDLTVS
jgi:hypothetical protein